MDTLTPKPPPVIQHKNEPNIEEVARWKWLFKVAGAAALISVLLVLMAIISHIVWPPPEWAPGAAIDWFIRFQNNWLLGLLGLDLLIVIGLVLGIPLFLALYLVLRPAGESALTIAIAFALIGTVLHLTSNTAFEMLTLSQGYTAAVTDAQRAMFLAAGEATLSSYNGTAFHVSYLLGYIAKIIIGAIMLRSVVFSKATAYMGILAGVTGLFLYLPTIGLIFSIVSVVIIAIWNAMIAYGFFKLERSI